MRKTTRPARRAPVPTSPVQPLALNRNEAAYTLGVGLSTLNRLISTGELRAHKVGRRVIIPIAAIEAYLQGESGSGVKSSQEDGDRHGAA